MSEKIEPCPACGSGRVAYDFSHKVVCQDCRHSGPMGKTIQDAITGWNAAKIIERRPKPKPPPNLVLKCGEAPKGKR